MLSKFFSYFCRSFVCSVNLVFAFAGFSVAQAQSPSGDSSGSGMINETVPESVPTTPAFTFGGTESPFTPVKNKKEVPSPVANKVGGIADTNIEKVIDSKVDLKPELGFEDLFLTKKSSTVLDIQNLGRDVRELCSKVTVLGILPGGDLDSSGGFRVTAGEQIGSTQILVYDGVAPECKNLGRLLKVYRVTVSDQDLSALLQELRTLIGGVEGIEIRIVGDKVVVDGNVLVPKEMRRVLTVLNRYVTEKKPVVNLVEMSPLTLKLIAEKMEEEIAGGKDRQRDIKVKVLNGRFFMEGNVDKRVDREVAEKICQSYVSERYTMDAPAVGGKLEKPVFQSLGECVSMIRIRAGQPRDPDPIINVRVDFVTLNRAYNKVFDFRWAPGVSADGGVEYDSDAGRFVNRFIGTITNLFPKLDTATQNGNARILKTVFVPVRDGDDGNGQPAEATVRETLNLGYSVQAGQGGTSQSGSTPVTTAVSIRARSISGSDRINLGIKAVQTEVKAVRANAPADTLENSVDTQVVVPNGESAAIGGIVAERRTVNYGRDPSGEGGVTVFKLDRKHQFVDDKNQFIIFVTPTKLRTTTEGTEVLKRKFRLRR